VAANIAAVVVVAHTAAGAAGAAEEVEDMKGSWTSGVVLLKKPLEVVGGRPFLAVVVKEAPDRRTWSESGAQTWEEEGSCAGLQIQLLRVVGDNTTYFRVFRSSSQVQTATPLRKS